MIEYQRIFWSGQYLAPDSDDPGIEPDSGHLEGTITFVPVWDSAAYGLLSDAARATHVRPFPFEVHEGQLVSSDDGEHVVGVKVPASIGGHPLAWVARFDLSAGGESITVRELRFSSNPGGEVHLHNIIPPESIYPQLPQDIVKGDSVTDIYTQGGYLVFIVGDPPYTKQYVVEIPGAEGAAESMLESLGLAQDARDEAVASRDAAEVSETNAKTSETNAKSSEDTVVILEAQAENWRTVAMDAATDAQVARNGARSARDRASLSQDAAKDSETNAKASEGEARDSQMQAASARDDAQGYASSAGGHASDAADSAQAASGSASEAAGSATDADSARAAAVSARGGAEDARDDAAGSATAAGQSAQDAAGAAQDALGHAQEAESWATSFDVSATADTGAPGTDAAVTVSGDGPAYTLGFTVPRGDEGEQGPPGEVSQAALDAAVATLVDGAPEALNTLDELAQALGGDPEFATTTAEAIGRRAKIDGAPEQYDSLGKLVAALVAGDLGGVADWGDLTGKPSVFPPAAHDHDDRYVGLSGNDTKTGDLLMDGGSINYRRPSTSAGWARGFNWKDTDDTTMGGFGAHGGGSTLNRLYIGHGASPWSSPEIDVGPGEVTVRGDLNVSGSTNLTAADVGAAEESHTHTPADVGLDQVDNTADADKPVSTATQQALDGKEPVAWVGTQAQYDALGSYDPDRSYDIVED